VHIVGSSSAGKQTLDQVRAAAPAGAGHPGEDSMRFFRANLHKVEGCRALAAEIKASVAPGHRYDTLFFTVGQWPDFANPLTPGGYEKGVFLAVVARFCVFHMLEKEKLIREDAVIMNVLASAQQTPPGIFLPHGSDEAFLEHFLPSALQLKQAEENFRPSLAGTLLTEGVLGDATVLMLAEQFPKMHFCGTMPGILYTDILPNSLGVTVGRVLFPLANYLGVTMTEWKCGIQHLSIAKACTPLSANSSAARNWAFWDHYLVPRRPQRLVEKGGEKLRAWLGNRMMEIIS
jgi:hypothetical protein